jgi:hypothetical protein
MVCAATASGKISAEIKHSVQNLYCNPLVSSNSVCGVTTSDHPRARSCSTGMVNRVGACPFCPCACIPMCISDCKIWCCSHASKPEQQFLYMLFNGMKAPAATQRQMPQQPDRTLLTASTFATRSQTRSLGTCTLQSAVSCTQVLLGHLVLGVLS